MRWVVLLLALITVGGCTRKTVEKPPEEVVAAPSDRPWNVRKDKAFAPAPDSRVGTLADGVGVPVGAQAPDAVVADVHGAEVRLSDLWKAQSILLVFYRGGW